MFCNCLLGRGAGMFTFLGALLGEEGGGGGAPAWGAGGAGGWREEDEGVRRTQVGARRWGMMAPTGGACSVRSSERR